MGHTEAHHGPHLRPGLGLDTPALDQQFPNVFLLQHTGLYGLHLMQWRILGSPTLFLGSSNELPVPLCLQVLPAEEEGWPICLEP